MDQGGKSTNAALALLLVLFLFLVLSSAHMLGRCGWLGLAWVVLLQKNKLKLK